MKKLFPFVLLFGFVFCLIFTGCPGKVKSDDNPDSGSTQIQVTSSEYFWGIWVRMDNGEEYEVLDRNVVYRGRKYSINSSDNDSLTVYSLGTFTKQSDSVMICNNIPYFRKGGANLEYSLKIVGFADNPSRAAASVKSGVKGKGKSSKYPEFESSGESDSNGEIKLKALPQTIPRQ